LHPQWPSHRVGWKAGNFKEGVVMRRFLVGAVSASAILLSAGPAAAHNVGPFVGPHQHVLTTPGTTVTIGPDGCATGGLGAFQDFHYHVHVGQPGADAFLTNPVSLRGAGC
jgi:hypothetical protein